MDSHYAVLADGDSRVISGTGEPRDGSMSVLRWGRESRQSRLMQGRYRQALALSMGFDCGPLRRVAGRQAEDV